MSGKYLTRDEILEVNDLLIEEVDVPEWGGMVLVRGLTGTDRDRLEASAVTQNGNNLALNLNNIRAKLVSMSVVNEDGKRLFTDSDIKDLGRKNAAALERVYDVAQRLSGMGKADVSELAKNLFGTPDDVSISA